jgi:DNA recombination protein RmuC
MMGDALSSVVTQIVAWAVACAVIGVAFGVLGTLLWRAKREQALRVEVEVLRTRIKTEDSVSAEREQSLIRAHEQLQGVFGKLASDSLQTNSETFLQLARERLARQSLDASNALKEREAAIESLVQPIREALAKTETQIQSIERDRIDAFATIKVQMEVLAGGQSLLSRETRNLVTALRRPDVRGQWGEITLKRLVELSGMTAHVDFTEQHHQRTESGAVRPDMIVHLPEQRDIIIDVKTPLEAYLAAVEAPDDEERAAQLRRHAQIVGARIRELASKNYWAQFEHSPNFVVLFLPGEQFLSAALQENPGLIDDSLRQNVMLATPTSLVALLKAVAYGWKQTVLADNAAEIRRLGEEVYKRLAVFGEHLGKLGKSLGSSVESFNKAVGSLEQQVLPAARRFPELGLRVERDLASVDPVASLARTPRGMAGPATQSDPSADEVPPEST